MSDTEASLQTQYYLGRQIVTPRQLTLAEKIRALLRTGTWPDDPVPFAVNAYELRCPFCQTVIASQHVMDDKMRWAPELVAMHECITALNPGVYHITSRGAERVVY